MTGILENRSVPSNTVLPHVVYRNLPAAIGWLSKTFGFREHYRYGDPVSGAQLQLENAWIMIHGPKGHSGSPAEVGRSTQSLTIFVRDVDAHYRVAKGSGARILEEPHETVYGEYQYAAEDLDGHHWLFSRHARDLNPEEWGAVLATPQTRLGSLPRPRFCYFEIPTNNVTQSVMFYECVFGWNIRKKDSERPSFDDATGNVSGAWVTGRRIASEPGLLPYIWVDDIEASVARVRECGGTILKDATPEQPGSDFRIALIQDPAGNTLGLYTELEPR